MLMLMLSHRHRISRGVIMISVLRFFFWQSIDLWLTSLIRNSIHQMGSTAECRMTLMAAAAE